MSAADAEAPTPDDPARLAELVAEILAAGTPGRALGTAVAALETAQTWALAAALYEALCYRVDVSDYWLHYRMWKAYRALGRDDAAFCHAAALVRMHPDWEGSGQAFRDMFHVLNGRGRDREALDVFRRGNQCLPEQAPASPGELAPILERLQLAMPELAQATAAPRRDACRLHEVTAKEMRPPWSCQVFGGGMPYALAPLTRGLERTAITVAEFADAEALIYRDSLVVLDRFGCVHEAFSIRQFPAQVHDTFRRLEAEGQSVQLHAAEDAVVVADDVSLPNICHTLLDQLTRLALYQRVGVDTGQALVIGSEMQIPAQREIWRRAGVTRHVGTGRMARVRARRLWVSSNCHEVSHAAHFGAQWAVDFVRRTLGGQGDKGWRRLYLSRGDVAVRRVTNEAEVMALLDAHGFEPITPGLMSYEAQLAAFRRASHVIAPHGAALTHLVLCPAGAQVLEIFHPLYGNPAYAQQAAASGIRYAAMVARDWEFGTPHWNDPALADVGASRFLDRHMRVDLDTLSRYLATVL